MRKSVRNEILADSTILVRTEPATTRRMLHHPGASLSEKQNASEMSIQMCMRYSSSRTTMVSDIGVKI